MAKTGGRTAMQRGVARMEVEHHGTIDNLIAAVFIDIGNREVVVALTVPTAVVVAVPGVAHLI